MKTARIVLIPLLAIACAKDPAADKSKAGASAPKEEKPAASGAEKLAIAPDPSTVEFVGSKVSGSHNGGFKAFTGALEFVPDKVEQSKLTVEIDMTSAWTDTDNLTKHLQSPDFFDVAKFPKASFVSTEIRAGGDKGATHTIVGNLELHGVKKSISIPVTIEVTKDTVTARSEFAINRQDFGIAYPGMKDDLIRDDVVIKLNIIVKRTATA